MSAIKVRINFSVPVLPVSLQVSLFFQLVHGWFYGLYRYKRILEPKKSNMLQINSSY